MNSGSGDQKNGSSIGWECFWAIFHVCLPTLSYENQRYRASGLNLVVSAIILWNTVYMERAVQALREDGRDIDETLLRHLSPLGWEHINLTGDYIWQQDKQVEQGKYRSLRTLQRS